VKPYHLDPVQFEAMIRYAETTAENFQAPTAREQAACRISRACVRPLYETLRAELERGTNPNDILSGFQPVLANIFGSLIHVCESNDIAVSIMIDWCSGLVAETIQRIRMIEGEGDADQNLVFNVEQAKGQRT